MNNPVQFVSRKKRSRKGVLVVCLLACLSVVASLLISSVQLSLRSRSEVRNQLHLVQASLLCEAGFQRGIKKLGLEPNYTVETWAPSMEGTSYLSAVVTIRVSGSESDKTIDVLVLLKSSEEESDSIQRSYSFRFSPQLKSENAND